MAHDDPRRPPPRNGGAPIKLTGRPQRQKVIGKEDQLNLRIALETSRTVEDFLAQL
jgi:hypothetical protein